MIFGTQVRQRAAGAVELVCPRCGVDRTGQQVTPIRRWCVFGIPMIRLGEHDPVVVCDECGHTSDLGVLDIPTTARLSALLADATIAALVLAVRSSDSSDAGRSHDAARGALRDAGFDDDPERFERALDGLTTDAAREPIRRIGPELTPHGKQGFLHRVASVLSATEPIDAAQRDVLARIGRDLGMAAPHINGVVAVATAA